MESENEILKTEEETEEQAVDTQPASSDEEVKDVQKSNQPCEVSDEDDSQNIENQPEAVEKSSDTLSFCPNCGAKLPTNAHFCVNCGAKLNAAAAVSPSKKEANRLKERFASLEPKKKKIFIIVASAVLVLLVALIIILNLNHGPDFRAIYQKHCVNDEGVCDWATVGADGSYLRVDTNPDDVDDYFGLDTILANSAIQSINQDLGLPESLYEDMGHTNSLMGKQSETFEKQGIIVTWSYHPNNGLEVQYKKLK